MSIPDLDGEIFYMFIKIPHHYLFLEMIRTLEHVNSFLT